MQTLIGRERELARIDRFLEERGALVLSGPRGVGVSALLEAAASRAGERVLRARGVQAESGFPYAGLHQLLRPLRRTITDEVLRAAMDTEAPDAGGRWPRRSGRSSTACSSAWTTGGGSTAGPARHSSRRRWRS